MGIFSFDAETNGLWGQAFSIAALVYDASGAEIARFAGRCPIQGEINPWVLENVLPQMTGLDETHSSYEELLRDFAVFYLLHKQENAVIAHVAVPVESQVLRDMHSQGFIGDWDGPFPLIDIVGMLTMANEDPTSVDSYCQKYGIHVSAEEFDGGTHNPLYDSAVAAQVYMHLLQSRENGLLVS